MRLIHEYKVVLVGIPILVVVIIEHFVEAAVADKAGILVDAEILEGRYPVLLNRRRIDNQNLRVVASVLNEELLGNHRGDDRLAKTNHVGEEETVVADKLLIAFDDSIRLILELVILVRNIEGIVLVNF